jgi:hypothetical protein
MLLPRLDGGNTPKTIKPILTPKNRLDGRRSPKKKDEDSRFSSFSDLGRNTDMASPKNFRIKSRPSIIVEHKPHALMGQAIDELEVSLSSAKPNSMQVDKANDISLGGSLSHGPLIRETKHRNLLTRQKTAGMRQSTAVKVPERTISGVASFVRVMVPKVWEIDQIVARV